MSSYTYTEPISLRYSGSQSNQGPLPEFPSLDSANRQSTSRSIDRTKWKQQQILQHNQQLLKQNEILSKRLAELDKGIIGMSSQRKQSDRNYSEVMRMLTDVKKERDNLIGQNRILKGRIEQIERERENENRFSGQCGGASSETFRGGIEQIELLENRLQQIEKNSRSCEQEIFRLRSELEMAVEERDRILQSYEKDKEINQEIVKSMKTEIEDNRAKEKKVVDIVRILQKEKKQIESNYEKLKKGGVREKQNSDRFNKTDRFQKQTFQKRIQQLQQQLQLAQQTISQLNCQILKKQNFISKTLKQHKSRLTKALQSYIERIGISKKLKPAELLRERSSVLSEWDLNLDAPVEYQ